MIWGPRGKIKGKIRYSCTEIIATAFASSLKYDRWENGRETRHEFRNGSIIITGLHFRLIPREK